MDSMKREVHMHINIDIVKKILLKFKLSIRMGMKGDLRDFEHVVVVCAGVSISAIAISVLWVKIF